MGFYKLLWAEYSSPADRGAGSQYRVGWCCLWKAPWSVCSSGKHRASCNAATAEGPLAHVRRERPWWPARTAHRCCSGSARRGTQSLQPCLPSCFLTLLPLRHHQRAPVACTITPTQARQLASLLAICPCCPLHQYLYPWRLIRSEN